MLNTVGVTDSNMQKLCNVSIPGLINSFKSSDRAEKGAFCIGKAKHMGSTGLRRNHLAVAHGWNRIHALQSTGARMVPHDTCCWAHSKKEDSQLSGDKNTMEGLVVTLSSLGTLGPWCKQHPVPGLLAAGCRGLSVCPRGCDTTRTDWL